MQNPVCNCMPVANSFPSKPTQEVLTDYTRKVDFLKGILDAEKLVSIDSSCKLASCIYSTAEMRYNPWHCSYSLQSSATEKALANQFLAPGRMPTIANERMPATKTVHIQAKARSTVEMRTELLVSGLVYFMSRLTLKSTWWNSVKVWHVLLFKNLFSQDISGTGKNIVK